MGVTRAMEDRCPVCRVLMLDGQKQDVAALMSVQSSIAEAVIDAVSQYVLSERVIGAF